MKKVDKISVGDTFSFLTVTARLKNGYECVCLCGDVRTYHPYRLYNGTAKSCGCMRKTVAHNLANSPTYKSWRAMRDRCYKKTHHNYQRYGGRGIQVDGRWLASFVNFYTDMGDRPKGHTLDRKNNNGHYTKENCRWATPSQQAHNKSSNMMITYLGRTMDATQWAEELGINRDLLYDRIGRRGWPVEDALTKPADQKFLRRV